MLKLGRYSVGVGDRFAQQAEAQLQAFVLAAEKGIDITPVWNKSNREHLIVGSEPSSVIAAAETAVKKLKLEQKLARGCRPHPARNGGLVYSPFRFFHD